jgi:DNA polymerase-1
MSCSDPNLQQLPRGREFRSLIAAKPGYVIIAADFSQIELRVAALLSQDEAMLQAYRDGADIHRRTAAALLGIPEEEVTKLQRQQAKALAFGTLYGSGPHGLAVSAKAQYGVEMSVEEARAFQRKFFMTYAQLKRWQDSLATASEKSQTVTTPGGRVRDFRREKRGWKRTEAVNTPCQAGAAEVMLETLAILDDALVGDDAQLVNVVHDELVLEACTERAEAVRRLVEDAMREGFLRMFDAPYMLSALVESGVGATWEDAK